MNNEKQHIDHLNLIGKYLANEASEEEINVVEAWVKKDAENQKTFHELKQAWMLSNTKATDEQINLNAEWAKLNATLFDEKELTDESASEIKNFNYNKFLKVAAIIVIFLTAGYFLFYLVSNPSTEQLVAGNTIISGTLPDGTEVTLNHNSILKFPKIFASNIRAVQLQGDA